MSLDSGQIAKIAALAHLKVDAAQVDHLTSQLNGIMALADRLASENTQGVEPMAHPLAAIQEVALRLRADQITEIDQRQALMQNAPASQDGLFLVPRVIE